MIKTYEEAVAVLSINPTVPSVTFWPAIGVSVDAARAVARAAAKAYGITYLDAVTCMEIGATLARAEDAA